MPAIHRCQLASLRFQTLTAEQFKMFLRLLAVFYVHAASLHESFMEVQTKSRLCRLLPSDVVQAIKPTLAQESTPLVVLVVQQDTTTNKTST